MKFKDILASKARVIVPGADLAKLMKDLSCPDNRRALGEIILKGGFCFSPSMLSDIYGASELSLMLLARDYRQKIQDGFTPPPNAKKL